MMNLSEEKMVTPGVEVPGNDHGHQSPLEECYIMAYWVGIVALFFVLLFLFLKEIFEIQMMCLINFLELC